MPTTVVLAALLIKRFLAASVAFRMATGRERHGIADAGAAIDAAGRN